MNVHRNMPTAIVIVLVGLCYIGCGQGGDSGSPASPQPQSPQAPSPSPTAGVRVTIPDPGLSGAITAALGQRAGDPVTSGELSTLESLDAGSAGIADLTGLESATGLRTLELYDNNISDISALAGLTGLVWLDLSYNSISDISALAGLTGLETLDLSFNDISDLSMLASLTGLGWLNLGDNNVSAISALAGLTGLETLHLSGNDISDISALAGVTGLDWLNLSHNSISDISALARLTALESLYLTYNDISDISALAGLTGLRELSLANNGISDVSALARLTGLRYLDLTSNDIADLTPVTRLPWGAGDVLYAADNPLRRPSHDWLVTLADAGVAVDYDLALDNEFPSSPLVQLIDDRILAMRVSEDLTVTSTRNGLDLAAYAREIYRWFDDDFDYLVFVSNLSSVEDFKGSVYVGTYRPVMNDTEGTGRDIFFNAGPGSAGKLRGMIHFPYRGGLWRGPGLHELLHSWANYAVPSVRRSHWGFSSANGQLGGFDLDDLVELGGGRYSAGRFGTIANGGNGVPYSPIELYFAGFIPPEEVPDLWVAVDGERNGNVGFGDAIFTASDVRTYSIEDIVAEQGPRVPSSSTAQRHFRAMVVLLMDDRPISRFQAQTLSEHVTAFSHPGNDESHLYNYYEATGGRGTIAMDGLSRFRKSRPGVVGSLPASFGRIPPPHVCEPEDLHPVRHQLTSGPPASPQPPERRPADVLSREH
ncbi:MAG: leucine-rich repeat domain-containing protein [Gammaproteobacteria bacterium]|nr:leucine-rich repeat domain-containing protein [Gammaproteobacteria bacterium]